MSIILKNAYSPILKYWSNRQDIIDYYQALQEDLRHNRNKKSQQRIKKEIERFEKLLEENGHIELIKKLRLSQ